MNAYMFDIDDGELICIKNPTSLNARYTGEDSMNRLRILDNKKYKKIRIMNSGIILENTNTRVYIKDKVLFSENNYQNCLYKNMRKISKAFHRYSKKNGLAGKKIKAGAYTGVAVVGILSAININANIGTLKDDTFVSSEVLESMQDEFELDVQDVTNVFKDNIVNKAASLENTLANNKNDEVIDQKENSTESLLNELEDNSNLVNINFDDSFDQVKYNHAFENHYNDICERAPRWGISTNLMLSILSQESGGYEENIMQIQWGSWADFPITIFNFEKGEFEKIVLTETPEKFQNQGITQFISKEDLKNPKTNISVACIILRYSFDEMDHNITAALQAYNFGVGNMNKVLTKAASEKECTVEDLLRNQADTSYLNYRNIVTVGDPKYVENTLRFIQNPNEEISISYIDENGNPQKTSMIINNEQSTRTL